MIALTESEIESICSELVLHGVGAFVQGVFAPTSARIFLELRSAGSSWNLVCSGESGLARLGVLDKRPPNPVRPSGWQAVLRRELLGARVESATQMPQASALRIGFHSPTRTALSLAIEVGRTPGIALLIDDARIVAISKPFRPGFSVGGRYAEPEASKSTSSSSRFPKDGTPLGVLRAVEAAFQKEVQERANRAARAKVASERKRLYGTIAKVQLEADRIRESQQLQREGLLLQSSFPALRRGMREVQVTDWETGGTVTICLDPKLTPAQEIESRFHRAKRFARGAAIATERLALLRARADELEKRQLSAPPAAPLEMARPKRGQARALPYRTFVCRNEQTVLVGRGAKHNEALTFRVASSHHWWLHARGVPGAHVVVPGPRGKAPSQDALVDAAHLAAHFSNARGESSVEVTYTQVKNLRRAGAPGAVQVTREKVLGLRVDSDHLKILLASERPP